MIKKFLIALIIALVLIGVVFSQNGGNKMKITSPSFKNNQLIPKKFTCQGDDISPKLVIENVPANAKSLVLIVDDPDAPMGTWAHWLMYNIVADLKIIEEAAVVGKQGQNSFRKKNYGGPCPPSGTHRYFFKLYALDTILSLPEGVSKKQIEKAMKNHIIEKAELIGLYKKE